MEKISKGMIKNFDQVKNNVENVGGETKPRQNTVHHQGEVIQDLQTRLPKGISLFLLCIRMILMHLDNMPKPVTAVKEIRAEKPNSLLLDAGDAFYRNIVFQ